MILPQIESICRLHGSRRGAVDLLVGDTREQFQDETSSELERVLTAKKLSLLFGLTRHIYVPKAVREPIQKAKIADELTKTRDQEQLTAKAQADLTEAKAKVVFEEKRTQAETKKMVAEVAAEGEKKAKEIEATTEKLKAEIDAKTAAIEAQTTRLLGEAKASSIKLSKEAKAQRFQLLVKALGSADAYERYIFAEGLPSDLRVGIFYAGPGTLWTDLKGFEQTMLSKLVSDAQCKAPPARSQRPLRKKPRNDWTRRSAARRALVVTRDHANDGMFAAVQPLSAQCLPLSTIQFQLTRRGGASGAFVRSGVPESLGGQPAMSKPGQRQRSSDPLALLAGGGEMGERTRAFDWSRTPLGAIVDWPQSLKTVVRTMLDSRYAMWLGWGPQFIFFYNDAYARMTLGPKHPWARAGRPARSGQRSGPTSGPGPSR